MNQDIGEAARDLPKRPKKPPAAQIPLEPQPGVRVANYFWLRGSAKRVVIYDDELKYVEPTPMGGVAVLKTGFEIKLDSPRPEQRIAVMEASHGTSL